MSDPTGRAPIAEETLDDVRRAQRDGDADRPADGTRRTASAAGPTEDLRPEPGRDRWLRDQRPPHWE